MHVTRDEIAKAKEMDLLTYLLLMWYVLHTAGGNWKIMKKTFPHCR